MDKRQKRLETLGKRFSDGQDVQPPRPHKAESSNRRRHSVYIDADLMKRIDTIFREVQYNSLPVEITKSLFLEKLLERGLQDLDGVKTTMQSG